MSPVTQGAPTRAHVPKLLLLLHSATLGTKSLTPKALPTSSHVREAGRKIFLNNNNQKEWLAKHTGLSYLAVSLLAAFSVSPQNSPVYWQMRTLSSRWQGQSFKTSLWDTTFHAESLLLFYCTLWNWGIAERKGHTSQLSCHISSGWHDPILTHAPRVFGSGVCKVSRAEVL